MSGLSNLTFMDGLMKGSSFVNGYQQQQRNNKRNDELFAMQQQTHEQQTQLNGLNIQKGEEDQLKRDFERDIRALEMSGQMPDRAFHDKYGERLGINRIANPERRQEIKQSYSDLAAFSEGKAEPGEQITRAIGTFWRPMLDAREKADGIKREPIGFKELPTGRDDDGDGVEDAKLVPILRLTHPDGSVTEAPLTRNGTGDDDDEIVWINDEKLESWLPVMKQQALIADAIDMAGGDSRKLAQTYREIVFGQPEQQQAFDFKMVKDPDTGTDRMAAINTKSGQFSHWIGGAGESRHSGRGRGGAGNKNGAIDFEAMLRSRDQIRNDAELRMNPELREQRLAEHDKEWSLALGAPVSVAIAAQEDKQRTGDFSPLTYEQLSEYQQYMRTGAESVNPDEMQIAGAGLADLQQAPPRAAPRAPEMMPEERNVVEAAWAQIQPLSDVMSDPSATAQQKTEARRALARITGPMSKKERQEIESRASQQRKVRQEHEALAKQEAEINELRVRLSDPSNYPVGLEEFRMRVDARKLAELEAKRQQNPLAEIGL